jgi:hypothetical protein
MHGSDRNKGGCGLTFVDLDVSVDVDPAVLRGHLWHLCDAPLRASVPRFWIWKSTVQYNWKNNSHFTSLLNLYVIGPRWNGFLWSTIDSKTVHVLLNQNHSIII